MGHTLADIRPHLPVDLNPRPRIGHSFKGMQFLAQVSDLMNLQPNESQTLVPKNLGTK